uniref:Carbamoyl-phosphate synthase (glutamine-hydrolyzing) n=1 Tax=Eutreptiella gymnastica TaxID=73025 RepID=A0A7S4GFS7_9EUGL
MLGHPESLTDPMYAGQVVALAYPIVANNGVPSDVVDLYKLKKNFESDKIHACALVLSNHHTGYSHFNSVRSLDGWLQENGVPGLCGIDTRALVKRLRDKGEMKGKVVVEDGDIAFDECRNRNLVKEVSCTGARDFRPLHFNAKTAKRIMAIDCGISNTLIRLLMSFNIRLRIVPWDYDIFSEPWDGLLVSSGPDCHPSLCEATVNNLKRALALEPPKPIMGIGLGCNMIALATGAKIKPMKRGNRGLNYPCMDLRTGKCYITPQNHGYEIDTDTLPADWKSLFLNLNDRTSDGICHLTKPFQGVQFMPGSDARPTDTDYILRHFMDTVVGRPLRVYTLPVLRNNLRRKTLVIGSPGVSTGETGQHDAIGCQSIRALREAQISVVLVNPNIASVQASKHEVDKVYFQPVRPSILEQIIQRERPDSIVLAVGGQLALDCGRMLDKEGILDKYNIEVLGTPLSSAELVDNRDRFAAELLEIGLRPTPFEVVKTMSAGLKAAESLGYPVTVSVSQVLEGGRQYYASDGAQLREIMEMALESSGVITVEKSLQGWKEVGYEVLRDRMDNCISVCDMENLYPLGVLSQDAIFVVPAQTLGSSELGMLQTAALKIIRHLNVIGSCHVRFALFPGTHEFYVTTVWTSLSGSAAFASRATGYPLGYVATKLSLGYALTEVQNPMCRGMTACYEPCLDYCAIRIPCYVKREESTTDVAHHTERGGFVGEVLAFGSRFSETIQKALRMANPEVDGLDGNPSIFLDPFKTFANEEEKQAALQQSIEDLLSTPSENRIYAAFKAMKMGWSVDEVYGFCKIDRWFLERVEYLADIFNDVEKLTIDQLSPEQLRELKCCGCSDKQIAAMVKTGCAEIRELRKKHGIIPHVRQVDTTGGEHIAKKEVLYMTYNATEDDVPPSESILVLGSGKYRIGYGCDNDWNVVACLEELHKQGESSIVVSCNPQSVATDFERSDRVYMEEISVERVLDIAEQEKSKGVICSYGGSAANAIGTALWKRGVHVLGTSPESRELVRDPHKFSALLQSLGLQSPAWELVESHEAVMASAKAIGYPCMVQPSMREDKRQIVYWPEELGAFLSRTVVSKEFPMMVIEILAGAQEIEMDAVARDGRVVVFGLIEHVEKTGIHAGDATLVLPAQKVRVETGRRIEKIAHQLASALKINGPFKMHIFEKGTVLYVSDFHPYASRTLAFTSKVLNVDFASVATRCALDRLVKTQFVNTYELDYVAVKAPIFATTWHAGMDPVAGAEMQSTGAVACFGEEVYDAFLTAIMGTGFSLPEKGGRILISAGPLDQKMDFLEHMQILQSLGYELYGTTGTAAFYGDQGYPLTMVPAEKALELVKKHQIDLVINIPTMDKKENITAYQLRRAAVDYLVPLVTNMGCAKLIVQSLKRVKEMQCLHWKEYLDMSDIDMQDRVTKWAEAEA